uniref:Uncharacterized protein n=1 Tax=Timema shepardi TaxID=629360 RepID=A0A7R9B3K7_TIMSH|nr:unnamed protein product [Timema shepardi]
MNILATAVVCLLLNQGQCKQESPLTSETSSWDKAGDPSPPVQLDPELRSALLRALTELEKEAQHQSGGVAPNPVNGTSPDDDPIQENLKRDLQELISNLNGPAPYPEDQPEEDQETSDGKEPSANYEGSVAEPSRPDLGDNKYPEQDSYQQRVQQVTDFLTGSDLKHKLSSQSIEQPGNLLQQDEKEIKTGDNSNQAAIFFHNPDPIELGEQKDELESRTINTAIDISSNVIPSSAQEVSVSPRGTATSSAADTNVEKASVSIDSSISSTVHENTRDKGTSDDGAKPEVEDGDVSIFHAPLVAAFTPSVGFHFTQTQQQPSPQNTNNFQSAASFLVHQRAQPPLPLNNFNGNFVQQRSQGFVPIASQQQNSFFRSNGFSQQFPSQQNGFFSSQPQSTRSNGFNGFNNFRQQTQSLDSQLQNLLYQSGVAEDFNGIAPQEDLNIVSKVLSLNHEGRPQLRKTRGSPIEDGDKPTVEIQTQST